MEKRTQNLRDLGYNSPQGGILQRCGDHGGIIFKLSLEGSKMWLVSWYPDYFPPDLLYIFSHQNNILLQNPNKAYFPIFLPSHPAPPRQPSSISVCVLPFLCLFFELVILSFQSLFTHACFLECWTSVLYLKGSRLYAKRMQDSLASHWDLLGKMWGKKGNCIIPKCNCCFLSQNYWKDIEKLKGNT